MNNKQQMTEDEYMEAEQYSDDYQESLAEANELDRMEEGY